MGHCYRGDLQERKVVMDMEKTTISFLSDSYLTSSIRAFGRFLYLYLIVSQ